VFRDYGKEVNTYASRDLEYMPCSSLQKERRRPSTQRLALTSSVWRSRSPRRCLFLFCRTVLPPWNQLHSLLKSMKQAPSR